MKLDTAAPVRQAMTMNEQRTGISPQWTAEWDQTVPDWQQGFVLTEAEAVELALRNNRELRAELELIGQAEADLVQAGLLQNPVLSLATKFPSGGGRALFEGGLVPFQGLRDLWLIPLREEVADAALQQSILRAADLAISTRARTKILYAQIQYSQRAVELTQENLALIDQTLELIQARHAAGRMTQIEVNAERIRRLRLQSDILALNSEYSRLKQELLMVMGVARAGDKWTVTSIIELTELTPVTDEDVLLETALSQRFDLCASQWDVWAGGRALALARGEAWPAFDISVVFERDAAPRSQNQSFAATAGNAAFASLTGGEPSAPTIEPFGPKPRDGKWLVGPMIDMEIPIFDQNQAQIAKAAHELRRRYALQSALEQRVIQKVREFRLSAQQAYEQVMLFRSAIMPEVEKNLEIIRQSYRAGADVFTDYLRAEEDLVSLRLAEVGFLRDALVNVAELEREVGGRLPPSANENSQQPSHAPTSTP